MAGRRPRRPGGTLRDGERRQLARASRNAGARVTTAPGETARVLCDGGSRGNPGPAAIAALLITADGAVARRRAEQIGTATAAQAEYRALLLGLELARAQGVDVVEVRNDSQLAIAGVRGGDGPREPELAALVTRIHRAAGRFASVTWTWHPSAENTAPDAMVRELLWAGGR